MEVWSWAKYFSLVLLLSSRIFEVVMSPFGVSLKVVCTPMMFSCRIFLSSNLCCPFWACK